MNDVWTQLLMQWQQQSLWEIAAVILALAYVWLAARGNRLCWPAGFASTAIYTVLFWKVSLPFQSLLNLYYMVMAVYGWWNWNQVNSSEPKPFQQRRLAFHGVWVIALIPVSYGLVQFAEHWFVSAHVFLDAAVLVFSLFATYLMTQKIAEHWLYWMVIDVVAGYLYWIQGLYLTGILFFSYFIFSVYGYIQWRNAAHSRAA